MSRVDAVEDLLWARQLRLERRARGVMLWAARMPHRPLPGGVLAAAAPLRARGRARAGARAGAPR